MARSRPFAAFAGNAAWAIAIGAAAVVVYAGALSYSFSQDDYAWLARAGGLFPRLGSPWRWLSQEAFFDAWRALFALDARAYHAASLSACAAGAILLFALLRRWVAAPAAAVGAAFFATHPAVYTAVYWISALGDLLALDFALATAMLAFRRDAWRWAAVPAFALSLVSKESTLLLPLFLLLARPRAKRSAAPEPVVAVLVGIAAGYGAWLVAFGGSGAPAGSGGAAPYAIAIGPHVGTNLLTYAGWGIDMLVPFAAGFTDAIDPPVFAWGAALIAAWLVGCASAGLRRRGWRLAGAYALLLLLPMLGLRNHTYHYYMVAALPGVAWMVAALADVALAAPAHRAAWVARAAAILAIAALTVNGRLLVHRIETASLGYGSLRADPTVDRALVMDRMAEGIAAAHLPGGTRLLLWSPARLAAGEPADAPSSYAERNVRAAAVEGLAVRVLFPQLSEARFVTALAPVGPDGRYGVFGDDGRTDVFTWGALDSIVRAERASGGLPPLP